GSVVAYPFVGSALIFCILFPDKWWLWLTLSVLLLIGPVPLAFGGAAFLHKRSVALRTIMAGLARAWTDAPAHRRVQILEKALYFQRLLLMGHGRVGSGEPAPVQQNWADLLAPLLAEMVHTSPTRQEKARWIALALGKG